jgi:anti-anti-sigma factor
MPSQVAAVSDRTASVKFVAEMLNRTQGALQVVATAAGEVLAVGLVGELDLASTDLIAAVDGLDMTGISTISVDLSGTEFIDSTGVQALLRLHTHHAIAGREVLFVDPQPLVRRVFATLGIDHYLSD